MPETSVVIRTFNEEKHLGNLLRALQTQKYTNYEVIVVDSGSTDGTVRIAEEFKARVIRIESRDFTFGYSLNVGCRAAEGQYLVFCSAHVLPVNTEWLGTMVAPFQNEKVAMVYGRQKGAPQSKFSEKRDFARLFGKLPINSNVPIDYANNANSAIRKSLWVERPFDEYLFGLEDIDWARAMLGKEYLVHYAPVAAIIHIHEESWPQVFNRYRREAIAAARIGMDHPPQSRVGYSWLIRRVFDDVFYSFPNIFPWRLEEILRFRFYQWQGSRQGWYHDRGLDLDRNKFELFFPEGNESVVIEGRHQARLAAVPLPDMKPGDILIKIEFSRVTDADLLAYEGGSSYPTYVGKEFVGTIAKLGASTVYRERFAIGERVVGIAKEGGAHSKFIVVPGDSITKVLPNVDPKLAILAASFAHTAGTKDTSSFFMMLQNTHLDALILPLQFFKNAIEEQRTSPHQIFLQP